MIWTDSKTVTGGGKFPGTARTVNNALIGVVGDWEAEVSVTSGKKQVFYARMANCQKDLDAIKWRKGLAVVCVMRYGESVEKEREATFEVSAKFQISDGEDHERELELILAVLRALAKEEAFPNARMAINVRGLLSMPDTRDYLAKLNFPAAIWPRVDS